MIFSRRETRTGLLWKRADQAGIRVKRAGYLSDGAGNGNINHL